MIYLRVGRKIGKIELLIKCVLIFPIFVGSSKNENPNIDENSDFLPPCKNRESYIISVSLGYLLQELPGQV